MSSAWIYSNSNADIPDARILVDCSAAAAAGLGGEWAFWREVAEQVRQYCGHRIDRAFVSYGAGSSARIFRLLRAESSAFSQGIFHLDCRGTFPRRLRPATGPAHGRNGAGGDWRWLAHSHLRDRVHGP